MRKSKVLAKLRGGRFARVCGLGHYLPFFIRHAAHFRYDAIWLDLEHRAMNQREIQSILAFCVYNDIDCMVRPPTLSRSRLYRLLEDGATGFMIPFVSDENFASAVVQSVKFPPIGNRGADGAGLDGDYNLSPSVPGSTYFEDANRETFIVAQIETPEAVENADRIAAVAGIDLLFVGPGDLQLRLRTTPGGAAFTLADAIERVAAAAERHDKAWGCASGSLEELTRLQKMGAQMVPWGGDFNLLGVLDARSKELDSVLED